MNVLSPQLEIGAPALRQHRARCAPARASIASALRQHRARTLFVLCARIPPIPPLYPFGWSKGGLGGPRTTSGDRQHQ